MAVNQFQNFLSNKLKTSIKEIKTVGGGCINATYKIITPNKLYFCKINSASKLPHLFEKEKNGLLTIEKQNIIQTPKIIDCFIESDHQFLILEWIEEGIKNQQFWKLFGQQLAGLHQATSEQYGLDENNYMGGVPQKNNLHQDWISFFIDERLQPMLISCRQKGLLSQKHEEQSERLYQRLPEIFNKEKPALLHGDLWSGNYMCSKQGKPVLIDPAVYFGHRSIDLAMSTLFGGFDKSFYEAYRYHSPFPDNHLEQWKVCNLYPLLIHLFLFGSSYLSQIEQTLNQFD